jgi:membrane protein
VLMFVGGHFARDLFGFVGLGFTASDLWNLLRWPAAVGVATIVFSWVYYITPDVHHRAFRWITPGAVLGVLAWVAVSFAFSLYISNVANVGAIYGAFTGAILLVGWLWLTNVALLFGAELDAEIEREKEISEGVHPAATLTLPAKGN